MTRPFFRSTGGAMDRPMRQRHGIGPAGMLERWVAMLEGGQIAHWVRCVASLP